jgi:hypothetical protein
MGGVGDVAGPCRMPDMGGVKLFDPSHVELVLTGLMAESCGAWPFGWRHTRGFLLPFCVDLLTLRGKGMDRSWARHVNVGGI